jgi:hypothetical protein
VTLESQTVKVPAVKPPRRQPGTEIGSLEAIGRGWHLQTVEITAENIRYRGLIKGKRMSDPQRYWHPNEPELVNSIESCCASLRRVVYTTPAGERAELLALLRAELDRIEASLENLSWAEATLLADVGLSVRCCNAFKEDGIVYVGDLLRKTEGYLLRLPNFGRASLKEVKEWLDQNSLTLGMK